MEVGQPYRVGRWRLVAWLSFVLLLAGLGYASQAAGSELPDDIAYKYSSAVAAVVQFAVFVGILLLITLRLPKRRSSPCDGPPPGHAPSASSHSGWS